MRHVDHLVDPCNSYVQFDLNRNVFFSNLVQIIFNTRKCCMYHECILRRSYCSYNNYLRFISGENIHTNIQVSWRPGCWTGVSTKRIQSVSVRGLRKVASALKEPKRQCVSVLQGLHWIWLCLNKWILIVTWFRYKYYSLNPTFAAMLSGDIMTMSYLPFQNFEKQNNFGPKRKCHGHLWGHKLSNGLCSVQNRGS